MTIDLLNTVYDATEARLNPTRAMSECFDDMDYHERFAVAVLEMHSQVCNGGFQQYLDNAYADPDTLSFLDRALKKMLSPAASAVRDILASFANLCDEIDWELPADEDEFEAVTDAFDPMDTAYYALSDRFVEECCQRLAALMPAPTCTPPKASPFQIETVGA
jgi:hypothetical protein